LVSQVEEECATTMLRIVRAALMVNIGRFVIVVLAYRFLVPLLLS
jgi:hypothetical protein